MPPTDDLYEQVVRNGQRRRRRLVAAGCGVPVAVVVVFAVIAIAGGAPGRTTVAVSDGATTSTTSTTPNSSGQENSESSSAASESVASATASSASADPDPTMSDEPTTTTEPSTTYPATTVPATTSPAPGPHTYVIDNDAVMSDQWPISLSVKPGDRIEVHLIANVYLYSCCLVDGDDGVLRADSSSANDSGNVDAVYTVMQAGHAGLNGTADPGCRQAQPPCMAPSRSIRIDITSTD